MRQTIIEDLAAGRRVRLHARVAEALEQAAATRAVAAATSPRTSTRPAASSTRARRCDTRVRPATRRPRGLAFDVAAEHYERARRAHDRLPDGPVEERLDLDLACGRALKLAGDERADAALRRTAADAEAAGDGARMTDALLAIALG